MRSTGKTKYMPARSGLMSGVVLMLLAVPMVAQPAAATRPGQGVVPAYDAAHEIVVNGTIENVVTKHTIGSPAGMHLLVAGAQGTVDAHVGFALSKEERGPLHTGLPVQIVGAMRTLNGKPYLLARQIMYGGRTLTVRSHTGFLVAAAQSPRVTSRRGQKAAQLPIHGGVQ